MKRKNHGGKRTGAGRKATGRNASTRSITLPNPLWNHIDSARGELSASNFIKEKMSGSLQNN